MDRKTVEMVTMYLYSLAVEVCPGLGELAGRQDFQQALREARTKENVELLDFLADLSCGRGLPEMLFLAVGYYAAMLDRICEKVAAVAGSGTGEPDRGADGKISDVAADTVFEKNTSGDS